MTRLLIVAAGAHRNIRCVNSPRTRFLPETKPPKLSATAHLVRLPEGGKIGTDAGARREISLARAAFFSVKFRRINRRICAASLRVRAGHQFPDMLGLDLIESKLAAQLDLGSRLDVIREIAGFDLVPHSGSRPVR